MIFPLVMYSCESSTVKKAECQRNWCLRTPVLEKTPESPLDNKDIKQVSLKGDQTWILIGRTEALVFWFSDIKSQLFGKVPVLAKIEDRRRRGHQRMRGLDGIADAMDMNLGILGRWWGTGRPGALQSMGLQSIRHDGVTEQQQHNTTDCVA